MDSKKNQKIVYGAGEGYPSTGTAAGCKTAPLRRHRATAAVWGWASRPPDTYMPIYTGLREGSRNPTLWPSARDLRGVGRGGDAAAAGDEIRRRNVAVFFLFGRCGRARQAVVPQDYRARWRHEGNAPGGPTGAIMGPPSPPPALVSVAPFPLPDGLGSNAKNKKTDRFGGLGPPDSLEHLKILFFRKLEEWWREIKTGGRPPRLRTLAPPQEPCKHARGRRETPRGRPWSRRPTR